jgi:tetratricopeptide (TPR) repeat protein
MGRPAEALELLEDVFNDEPEEVGHWNLKAATLGRLGDFEQAIGLYENVLERSPRQPRVWLSYGHMLKTVGRLADGISAYRKAIEMNSALGEAWWSLANLKTVKFGRPDLTAMRAALATTDLGDEDRFHLDFALGKAMHDAGQTDQAFEHYAKANALRLKGEPYEPQKITNSVDRCIAQFTSEAFAERQSGGCEARDPIFILGMPRAGSTLLEQVSSPVSGFDFIRDGMSERCFCQVTRELRLLGNPVTEA